MFVFGGAVSVQAQRNQTIKVQVNKQKSVPSGGLTIKFVSLVEDSRCPTDANCVWAGNAKIQVQIGNRRGKSEIFELNTNMGAKGASFGGYAVNLISLTPAPRSNIRINRNGYVATFSVNRLTR
jgi:hypothetical protein